MEEEDSKPSRAQWIYVYVKEDKDTEKWVTDKARVLTGDYREEGTYNRKKYFVRKEHGKVSFCIFWSSYLGFDGAWYLGPTLGGAGHAWAKGHQEMPPDSGWVMGGTVMGYHYDAPIKIKSESVILHEVHACEDCVLVPCRFMSSSMRSLGGCLAGVCIATVHGSTDGVPQLKERPSCTSCMEGMLSEMSCSVPLSHAFEHSVDAWYKSWFIDGYCHTAAYQRSIVAAETNAHIKRLKLKYGGYTSRVAQEMACHEPFAKAVGDLLHISSEHVEWAKEHPHGKAIMEETSCHVPLNGALEHLINHTHEVSKARIASNEASDGGGGIQALIENTCLTGVLACLFCAGHKEEPAKSSVKEIQKEAPVKVREIEIQKSAELTSEAKLQDTTVIPSKDEIENDTAAQAEARQQRMHMLQMQTTIDAERQQSARLEAELAQVKQLQEHREMRQREVEDVYARRLSELETNSNQKASENVSLQAQLTTLQSEVYEHKIRRETDQEQTKMLLGVQDSQAMRVQELEAEIHQERGNTSKHKQQMGQMEQAFNLKLRDMELSHAQHTEHRQKLEQELGMRQQQEGTHEVRIRELQLLHEQKLREAEAFYSKQIEDLSMTASQADSHHQSMNQQLELFINRHEQEKHDLRQQHAVELNQAEQARAILEKEHNQLALQLEASEQNSGSVQALQYDFEAKQQVLESRHTEQVEQLEMAIAAEHERSRVLEQRIQETDLQQTDSRALEEALVMIQKLEERQAYHERHTWEVAQASEQQRIQHEAELTNLAEQLTIERARPKEDYAQANLQLNELRSAMEVERQSYEDRVAELESALLSSTQENQVLRGQVEIQTEYATESASGELDSTQLVVSTAVVVERFVSDSMDASSISLEVGETVEVLSVQGSWITVKTASGQTGEVPVVCLDMSGKANPSIIPESPPTRTLPVVAQTERQIHVQERRVAGYDGVVPKSAPTVQRTSSGKSLLIATQPLSPQTATRRMARTPASAVASGGEARYVPVPRTVAYVTPNARRLS